MRARLGYGRSSRARWACRQAFYENELKSGEYGFVIFAILFIRFFDFALLTPPLFFLVGHFPIQRKQVALGIVRYVLCAIPFCWRSR